MQWNTRPPTQDDFEAVRALIETCLITDYGVPEFSADRMKKSWETEGFDLTRDAWVVVGENGRLLGYADVMDTTAEETFVSVYAAPTEQAAAVIAHLLDLANTYATEHPEKPSMMKCRVSDVNKTLMAALEEGGYERYLSFLMMEVVLDAPPETPQWAEGITVRNFVPHQDDYATYVVDEGASADKGYYHPMTFEEWKERVNLHGENFDAGLWWLACSGLGTNEEETVGVAINVLHPTGTQGWVDHFRG